MVSDKILQLRFNYPWVAALAALFTGAGYALAKSNFALATVLFIFGVFTMLFFLWKVENTNRVIAGFLNAWRNDDTSQQFPVGTRNPSLSRLYEAMNKVNRRFQSIRMQIEYNENYYKALIRHANSGLLVLNKENQVNLINQVACKYAGISPESTNPNLLKIKNPEFFDALCKLKPGDDVTYKHILGSEYQLLTFRATLLHKDDQTFKLISIQDIRHEMESRELESYRKLIRVLTHEIMNLMSPITSVSKTLQALYHHGADSIELTDVDNDTLKTTLNGLQLINEQSKSIMTFIENYRKISRIPQPVIAAILVDEWIEQLRIVYTDKMLERKIQFEIRKDTHQKSILGDKNLLNQVLINLLNNAMDAVMEIESDRTIRILISTSSQNRIRIKISNNGPFIPPEIQEKIYVPFFTTKLNGSGIGLSICQEIIKLHNGSLVVISSPDSITSFIIEL